ncbi:glycosyltransferase family 9 protein [Segetibacter sp.]|jgi:lipopolysaccharide heptosyltransferase II|uniref:glycosyltransferase family 9 protein n=1 Tax=Segetibacter sp. TaxID=2231182 RepID=UPI00261810CB|nr:glycosyltransferase family 9 protein [Segetibacter sp.]MCW3080073.1 glycosyl transferase family 9 [Segetibacter sp.]
MTQSWQHCKNILIIRADNMGDLIMSTPAIRAIKETFSSKITVLTSSMAAGIVPSIPEIDDVIVFDLPWIKSNEAIASEEIFALVQQLKEKSFDAAVIFTVFSQNPLPAAMIAYMANIPLRLAYCRENPYALLTNWIPDKEPYTFIQHQVERDLQLVKSIDATTNDINLGLAVPEAINEVVENKLKYGGINPSKPWLIFHAGVSEKKREYPIEKWVEVAKNMTADNGFQILFTGSASEKQTCNELARLTGENAFCLAGIFSLQEFIALVKQARLVVSVNTGTVHIAAAVGTPVVVLYAQTNPQHKPWNVPLRVLEFGVDADSRSRNEVIQYLYKDVYKDSLPIPCADEIVAAITQLLEETSLEAHSSLNFKAI